MPPILRHSTNSPISKHTIQWPRLQRPIPAALRYILTVKSESQKLPLVCGIRNAPYGNLSLATSRISDVAIPAHAHSRAMDSFPATFETGPDPDTLETAVV